MRFGYTFIWVDDVPGAVDWFERALGVSRRVLRDNGPLGGYAELDTGTTTLAIADTREARALFPGGFRSLDDETPVAFQISFISDDVATDHVRALTAGAHSLAEPHDEPWGQTISRIRSPHGVVISIVSPPPSF
jgi:lactoylglutathione lyase